MTLSGSKVLILASHKLEAKICPFLQECNDEVVHLYLAETEPAEFGQVAELYSLSEKNIFDAAVLNDKDHIERLKEIEFDFIILVYWPYLLKEEIFSLAKKGTVNFHPALLPINRGWYPHVHSLIDGSPLGVTLHAIDRDADTGPIWCQKEIKADIYDDAGSLYKKLQFEILQLFYENWPLIKTGKIKLKPQDESRAVFHKKSEISELDEIDLEQVYKAKDLINLLRARSFGDLGFAYYWDDGKKVHLQIKLNDSINFGNK
jgi:methionyl-tRNA formyltransferase